RYGHRSPPCTDSPRGRHGAAPPGPRVPTTSGRLTPTPADVREDRPRPRAPQRRSSRTPVLASGSLTHEDRLPLLRVRGQPLPRIVALEEELLQLPLDRQPLGDRHLPTGLHRALDVTHRLRRPGRRREAPRVLEHLVQELLAARRI